MALPLLQLFFAVFSIYSAIKFPDNVKFYIILVCLIFMLVISWVDKGKKSAISQKASRSEKDVSLEKEQAMVEKQATEALLRPKNELILIDAVHLILKDLGLKVSTGINYHFVDRIVNIPDREESFGVEIMMSGNEAEKNHPKFGRALEFEKEKKKKEKTLIIASTHTHLPVSERGKVDDTSEELEDFLIRHNISLITTYSLYEVWRKAKEGKNNIIGIFQNLYSHPGGIFLMKASEKSEPFSLDFPTPQTI
jgi:hypothetical protein